MVTGTLVVESLTSGADISVPLTVQRIHRVPAGVVEAGQPPEWTLIDFACSDEHVDELAAQLARSLASGPWYADYADEQVKWVIFAGKVFRYTRADTAAHEEALAFARQAGVPEAQIDWPR